MKRIVIHLLVAAGLAAGAVGMAQAHSSLSIGLSLGAPAYVQTAPVYAAPRPVYYPRYDHGWDQRGWNRGDDHRWEYRDRNHRSGDYGRTWGHWRD
jgi:hypothetical protein